MSKESLIKSLEFNPVANIFPLMQGAEYNQLKDDIAANGLLDPIWLDTEGKILDGRNRYRVCLDVGVDPQYRTYQGDDELKFVISKNLHRRHLSESQRAVIASRLANMQRGGDRPSENDSNFDSANLPIGNFSQPEAAEMLNVSPRTVATIKARGDGVACNVPSLATVQANSTPLKPVTHDIGQGVL